jgi:hypothetical protein
LSQQRFSYSDIGDYDRDPNIYQKHDYNPFGCGSVTWRIFYFRLVTPRKRVRVYASFGRTFQEALRGLEIATEKKGFKMISLERYNLLGGECNE